MGWNAQPTAQVVFEGARVPADAMLGGAEGEGTGFGIAMNGLNGGRINIAACSLGGAQAAYDKAAGLPRRPRGVRHAHCSTSRPSGSRSPTWPPRWRRRETCCGGRHPHWTPSTRTRSSCARWPSATSPTPASTVADQALQLHGGYGYLREYGLEKIVRDLRVHRILEGTNEIMRVVIGRAEAARARAS